MKRVPWIVLALVLVAIPFAVSGYRVFQLSHIVIYAIAILGLNLLTGISGQISLGNGAFYALGAYAAAIAIGHLDAPYWLAPPIAGAVCFVAGYAFGRPAARLEGIYLALATFGLATVMPQLLRLDALERWTGGNQGIHVDKPVSPIPDVLDDDQWLYAFCLAIAVAMFVLARNLIRGRTGRAWLALRDHPIAAAAMGVPTARYKVMAFAISAMFTGVAGALGTLAAGFIAPDSFTSVLSIQFLVGGVVGGIASIGGTVFGAAFIELVPDWSKQLSDAAPAVIYGALLIAFMLIVPGGMAGLVHAARTRMARARR